LPHIEVIHNVSYRAGGVEGAVLRKPLGGIAGMVSAIQADERCRTRSEDASLGHPSVFPRDSTKGDPPVRASSGFPVSGAGRDEAADDDVFFQAFEVVFFAADRRVNENARGLLKGCGGKETGRGKRHPRDAQQ